MLRRGFSIGLNKHNTLNIMRYFLAILMALIFATGGSVREAQTDVVDVAVLVVESPHRVLRSVPVEHPPKKYVRTSVSDWFEANPGVRYVLLPYRAGTPQAMRFASGAPDDEKLDDVVDAVVKTARMPIEPAVDFDPVLDKIQDQERRKAAGQINFTKTSWGLTNLVVPHTEETAGRASGQSGEGRSPSQPGTARPRPPAYVPPVWNTVLGKMLLPAILMLVAGAAVGGLWLVRLWGQEAREYASASDTSRVKASNRQHAERTTRKSKGSAAFWPPELESDAKNEKDRNSRRRETITSSGGHGRRSRRKKDNGFKAGLNNLFVVGLILIAGFWGQSAQAQPQSEIDQLVLIDASGSHFEQGKADAHAWIRDAKERDWTSRLVAFGSDIEVVGDVQPTMKSSEVAALINRVPYYQKTRLSEALTWTYEEVKQLQENGSQPVVRISTDFAEDTDWMGMEGFALNDSSSTFQRQAGTVGETGNTFVGANQERTTEPGWMRALAGGIGGILLSTVVWGFLFRRRRRDERVLLDNFTLILGGPDEQKEIHSAHSLLRRQQELPDWPLEVAHLEQREEDWALVIGPHSKEEPSEALAQHDELVAPSGRDDSWGLDLDLNL